MKMFVITNKDGKVIGTARPAEGSEGGPRGGRPIAGENQRVHELEIPTELATSRDVRQLHESLEAYLRNSRP